MIKAFTQNELIEYIYQNDDSNLKKVAIEQSKQLTALNDEFNSMKDVLNELRIKAPQRAIDNILAYAKQKKQSI